MVRIGSPASFLSVLVAKTKTAAKNDGRILTGSSPYFSTYFPLNASYIDQ
jgi:hypothetical protein